MEVPWLGRYQAKPPFQDPSHDSITIALGLERAVRQSLMLDCFAYNSEALHLAEESCFLLIASAKAALRFDRLFLRDQARRLGCQTLLGLLHPSEVDQFVGFLAPRQRFAVGAYLKAVSLRPSQAQHVLRQSAFWLPSFHFCQPPPALNSSLPTTHKILVLIDLQAAERSACPNLQNILAHHHVLDKLFLALELESLFMCLHGQF